MRLLGRRRGRGRGGDRGVGPGLRARVLGGRGSRRQVALPLPHWLSIPFVVARSDLIATVPEAGACTFSRQLRLQRLRCPVQIPRLPVSLVWHARTHDSESHRWFRDVALEVCGGGGAAGSVP